MKKLLQILLCLPVIGFGQNWNNDWDTDWSIFGWSKSGYVALFESHGYDLIGGCRYRLIIQNLKTDYEFSGCSLNYNSFKLEPHY